MSRPFEGRIRSLEQVRRDGAGKEKSPVRIPLPYASGDSGLTTEESVRELTNRSAREREEQEVEQDALENLRKNHQKRNQWALYEQDTSFGNDRPKERVRPLPVIDDARRASLQDLLRQYDDEAKAGGIVDIDFPEVDVRTFDPQSREAAVERSRKRAEAAAGLRARRDEEARGRLLERGRAGYERHRAGVIEARSEAAIRADEKEKERVRRIRFGNPNGPGTRAAYHLLDDGEPNIIIDHAGEYVTVPAEEADTWGKDFNATPLSAEEAARYGDAIPEATDAIEMEDGRQSQEDGRAAEETPGTNLDSIAHPLISLMREREEQEKRETAAERASNAPPIIDLDAKPLSPEEMRRIERRRAIPLKQTAIEARTREIDELRENISRFERQVEEQMAGIEKEHGINPVDYDEGSVSFGRKFWTRMKNAFYVAAGNAGLAPEAALSQNRINREYLADQQARLKRLEREREQLQNELNELNDSASFNERRPAQQEQMNVRRAAEAEARAQLRRMGSLRARQRPDYLPEADTSSREMTTGAEERARKAFLRVGLSQTEAENLARELREDTRREAENEERRADWQKKGGTRFNDTRYEGGINEGDWDWASDLDASETPAAPVPPTRSSFPWRSVSYPFPLSSVDMSQPGASNDIPPDEMKEAA